MDRIRRQRHLRAVAGLLERHADDLRLERLDVVYAGDETFPMADRIRAVPLRRVWQDLEPLR
jgi:hypothetical protein